MIDRPTFATGFAFSAVLACFASHEVKSQGFEYLPSMSETETDVGFSALFFYLREARCQWAYSVSEIRPGNAVFRSISWRAARLRSTPASRVSCNLVLSTSPRTITGLSTRFADNLSKDRATVFSGTLQLPSTGFGSAQPKAWMTPVPFVRPFVYAPSTMPQTLVVQIDHAGNDARQSYALATYTEGAGSVKIAFNNRDCFGSHGGATQGVGSLAAGVQPGKPAKLVFSGFAPQVPNLAASVLMIGVNGPGSKLFGTGPTLPVTLRSLGFPGPDFCSIAIDPLLFHPMTYDPVRGTLEPRSLVFPSPAFDSARVFVQALAVDRHPILRTPAFLTSPGVELRLGNGKRAEGRIIFAQGRNATTGTILTPAAAGGVRLGR